MNHFSSIRIFRINRPPIINRIPAINSQSFLSFHKDILHMFDHPHAHSQFYYLNYLWRRLKRPRAVYFSFSYFIKASLMFYTGVTTSSKKEWYYTYWELKEGFLMVLSLWKVIMILTWCNKERVVRLRGDLKRVGIDNLQKWMLPNLIGRIWESYFDSKLSSFGWFI